MASAAGFCRVVVVAARSTGPIIDSVRVRTRIGAPGGAPTTRDELAQEARFWLTKSQLTRLSRTTSTYFGRALR